MMNLRSNDYAISPADHDWEREAWEAKAQAEIIREEQALARLAEWERFAYCDRSKPAGREEIESVMDAALDILYHRMKDKDYRYALFLAYCSDDHIPALRDMMREYLAHALMER